MRSSTKRGQVQFVQSTLRAVPANWTCPLFVRLLAALAVIGGAVVWWAVASLAAEQVAPDPETPAVEPAMEPADRLEDLAPREKEELRRKTERFAKLPAEEQARIRCLHADLRQHPDGDRLTQIASRYTEWLKTLSPGVRAELLALPLNQRLERIRKFKEEQQAKRVREVFRTRFKPEDVRAILTWLGQYAAEHEAELLSLLSSDSQQFLRRIPSGPQRHIALFRALQRRPDGQPFPEPTAEEFDELRKHLSDEASKEFDNIAEDGQRLKLVLEWGRAAMTHRMMPPDVSSDVLAQFYANLEQKDRDFLEQLPRERLQHELRKLYWQNEFRKRGGGPQSPFFRRSDGRPPHFHGGPRSPRGNGSRGNGDRQGDRKRPPFAPGGSPEGTRPPPPAAEEKPGF